jgi:drug/metabolite transporter (DMT)-like permease
MNDQRGALDATAIGCMLLLTFLWGFNHVAAKLAAPGVSLLLQAAIRSAVAAVLILVWARARGTPIFGADGSLASGLLAGLLFAVEFFFIFVGLAHTTASRMTLLLYVAPGATALGLAWLVPSERLNAVQWAGILLGFAGLGVAFADGFGADAAAASGRTSTAFGDACAVLAGLFWAATTVCIRASTLARVSAAKTTFYQLAVSAPLLFVASLAIGEAGVTAVTPVVAASLFYQSVIVAFASLLAWFWLLTRYLASRLAVFTFLTPLVGVAAGALVLGDPVSMRFLVAAVVVGVGIVLVNWRPAPEKLAA